MLMICSVTRASRLQHICTMLMITSTTLSTLSSSKSTAPRRSSRSGLAVLICESARVWVDNIIQDQVHHPNLKSYSNPFHARESVYELPGRLALIRLDYLLKFIFSGVCEPFTANGHAAETLAKPFEWGEALAPVLTELSFDLLSTNLPCTCAL